MVKKKVREKTKTINWSLYKKQLKIIVNIKIEKIKLNIKQDCFRVTI